MSHSTGMFILGFDPKTGAVLVGNIQESSPQKSSVWMVDTPPLADLVKLSNPISDQASHPKWLPEPDVFRVFDLRDANITAPESAVPRVTIQEVPLWDYNNSNVLPLLRSFEKSVNFKHLLFPMFRHYLEYLDANMMDENQSPAQWFKTTDFMASGDFVYSALGDAYQFCSLFSDTCSLLAHADDKDCLALEAVPVDISAFSTVSNAYVARYFPSLVCDATAKDAGIAVEQWFADRAGRRKNKPFMSATAKQLTLIAHNQDVKKSFASPSHIQATDTPAFRYEDGSPLTVMADGSKPEHHPSLSAADFCNLYASADHPAVWDPGHGGRFLNADAGIKYFGVFPHRFRVEQVLIVNGPSVDDPSKIVSLNIARLRGGNAHYRVFALLPDASWSARVTPFETTTLEALSKERFFDATQQLQPAALNDICEYAKMFDPASLPPTGEDYKNAGEVKDMRPNPSIML